MLCVAAIAFGIAGTDDYEFIFNGVNDPQKPRKLIAQVDTERV